MHGHTILCSQNTSDIRLQVKWAVSLVTADDHINLSQGFEFECCFNDIWSQQGHSVSCVTISFPCLQITKSDIRPQVTWAVNLVIADGQLILKRFVWVWMG